MKIGIISLQGDIEEHREATYRALDKLNVEGEVIEVKNVDELRSVNGIIIPGGESTTIGRLASRSLFSALKERIEKGLPVLATCAGLIVLAKKVYDRRVGETKQPLLGILDVLVERNAFGRQRESFEMYIKVPLIGEKPFKAVFIRAPLIRKVWGDAKSIANIKEGVVAVKQNNVLATCFHPELAEDTRFHELLIKTIKA